MGIRHRIREAPALMRRVTRLAVGVLSRYLVRQVKDPTSQQARPGFVVAWQTFGDNLTYHPHSYHGHFANAFGSLESRRQPEEASRSESPPRPRRTAWARLVLRVWQVDPELCPRCGSKMHRSRALIQRHELVRLLKSLATAPTPGAHLQQPCPRQRRSPMER